MTSTMPKIGVSSKIFKNPLYKTIKQAKTKIEFLEINARESDLAYFPGFIDYAKEDFKGIELSIHTKTWGLFNGVKEFTEAELAILNAEIYIAGRLGIKELIFHLSSAWDDEQNIAELKKIIEFAEKNKVRLIYESNAAGFTSESVYRFFEVFPKIKYNLDLGHLNVNFRNPKFGCTLDEFLDQMKDRIVYMHAHNNDGGHDQHKAITDGTLDWKHVLDKLDFEKIKIIIEVLTEEDYLKSKKAIEEYFEKKQK